MVKLGLLPLATSSVRCQPALIRAGSDSLRPSTIPLRIVAPDLQSTRMAKIFVTTKDIAVELGYTCQRVDTIIRRATDFPPPDAVVGNGIRLWEGTRDSGGLPSTPGARIGNWGDKQVASNSHGPAAGSKHER